MDKRLRQLNNLRTFECAARYQSYSAAAKELFISQAAVSQQMRQLETVLGTKLFIRNGRKMQLTSNGLSLYQSTHQAFETLVKGLNSIQMEDVAGYLTITSTQTFTSLWLMPRLYRFSIKHPEIKIKVTSSNEVEDLLQGHIDLAIRFSTSETMNKDDDMVYDLVGEDNLYPVCSAKLANEMNFSKPADLLKCWLVNLKNQGSINWPSWFAAAGVEYYQNHHQWTEVATGDMALSAVLSGHGCTLASESVFSQHVNTGQLVVPFDIKHPVSFKRFLVYDPNSAKKARIDVFIHWLLEEFAQDGKNLEL